MNVFDFAIEMEDSGCAYYKNLAKDATLPGLKTIFTELAEDEQKHREIFSKLKEGRQGAGMSESAVLDKAKNIFKLLPRGQAAAEDVTSVLDAYQHAMDLEAKSFLFYQDAAEKESDAEIKALLQQIATEEQAHFNILENVYHFVNAPNQSLEWGEFSNISEFHQYGRDTDS